MTTLLLFAVWGLLALYFLAHFILRKPRRLLNLVWTLGCTGWPAMAAREHRWLSGLPATALVVIGVGVGMMGLGIVALYEAQQRRFLR